MSLIPAPSGGSCRGATGRTGARAATLCSATVDSDALQAGIDTVIKAATATHSVRRTFIRLLPVRDDDEVTVFPGPTGYGHGHIANWREAQEIREHVAACAAVPDVLWILISRSTAHPWELTCIFVWQPEKSESSPALTVEQYKPFADCPKGHPVRAVVGHTYAVRKLVPGKHDHLVAFEIIAEDERGIFITWKVLKT